MARWPNQTSDFEGKEAHAGTWFEHCHTGMDVGRHDRGWGLHEPPEGACKEPPNPPRADAVTSHANLCKTRLPTLRGIRYRNILHGLAFRPCLDGAQLEGADLIQQQIDRAYGDANIASDLLIVGGFILLSAAWNVLTST